jgi:hypothetical protein
MNTELNQSHGGKTPKMWAIEIGLYPGILFGVRTYKAELDTTHVLYLPFIDLALIVEN